MSAQAAAPTTSASASPAGAVKMFGRFQLLRLLGKSERAMAWDVLDTRSQAACQLVIPRRQPGASVIEAWRSAVQRASRLHHPHLARAIEIGEHERWPFVAYDRSRHCTWQERFSRQGVAAAELAAWSVQAAQGLAFAHEAGFVHRDLQPWMLAIDDNQQVVVMGLEVAGGASAAADDGAMAELRAVRDAAEVDLLALGLVMHHALVGQPALEEPDAGKLILRLAPLGQEFVRLPWSLPRPIPEPLRAIVNRATDRQPRQRYRNARTLQRALEGWLKTQSAQDGGPLALLLDRLRSVGALPSQPGGAERVAHLALMEGCRTSELADVVLSDIALSFELLRVVNAAHVNGERVSGDGPVLMIRRAVAMLGLEGVRRAALSLRSWPGPMNETAARDMDTLLRRVHRAARVAVRLAPAGYDAEVIYLIALLQNLGRLLVAYHFPEEAVQIRRLTLADEVAAGASEEPGMSPEGASYAVLGLDIEELGLAVAQHWGFDESVLHMIRRIPAGATVHPPDGDSDVLRASASCANELIDAMSQPARQVQSALKLVAQRYARALSLTGREMQEALQLELQASPTQSPVSPDALRPVPPAAASAARQSLAGRAAP